MSDDEDYNSEEDVDYVPSDGEPVSEEDNSGEDEDLSLLQDDGVTPTSNKVSPKKRRAPGKKKNVIEKRRRCGGIKLDDEDGNNEIEQHTGTTEEEEVEAIRAKEFAKQIAVEEERKKVEKEKKRADDLWSSFMADVKTKPVVSSRSSGSSLGSLTSQISGTPPEKSSVKSTPAPPQPQPESSGKIILTKVFDFAGEEVKVTKEVDADSKEAKAEKKKQERASEQGEAVSTKAQITGGASIGAGMKSSALSGLGSVLNKISKKNKMGTLEKSKYDWEAFKSKEGIDEDLKIHNKGKQGYTERMAFLNRADQRQYEIERDLRLGNNSKR